MIRYLDNVSVQTIEFGKKYKVHRYLEKCNNNGLNPKIIQSKEYECNYPEMYRQVIEVCKYDFDIKTAMTSLTMFDTIHESREYWK